MEDLLTIGELAKRAGVATSALRFYEERGLISSERTDGNQRRYQRATLRTVAIVRAAQEVGITLARIEQALASLPEGRTATKGDWAKLARGWSSELDQRIDRLTSLRDDLDGCIGCGCLSLNVCNLFNPGDQAGKAGSGAQLLLDT